MALSASSNKSKTLDVVCLVMIDKDNQILATRRAKDKPLGLFWEFPGGKIDHSETAEVAIRREIQEELGIELEALTQHPSVTHRYDFGTIRLIPFFTFVETRPALPHLHAHEAARWIALNDWEQLQWAPADVPIIKRLLQAQVST